MLSPGKVKKLLRRIANSIGTGETEPNVPPYNFLTGSHVYGKPNKNSDIDLVVMVDAKTEALLQKLSESETGIRFGKLSLICCHNELEMAVWRVGTEQMKLSGKSFHKKQAKAVLDKVRNLVDQEDRTASGS